SWSILPIAPEKIKTSNVALSLTRNDYSHQQTGRRTTDHLTWIARPARPHVLPRSPVSDRTCRESANETDERQPDPDDLIQQTASSDHCPLRNPQQSL
ncbi:MAG: hypothetical protein KDA81_22295, partial [Planctomycetaceae bacterium]|nr:hypothetical protein [Planctomycetaceae bacterium]